MTNSKHWAALSRAVSADCMCMHEWAGRMSQWKWLVRSSLPPKVRYCSIECVEWKKGFEVVTLWAHFVMYSKAKATQRRNSQYCIQNHLYHRLALILIGVIKLVIIVNFRKFSFINVLFLQDIVYW